MMGVVVVAPLAEHFAAECFAAPPCSNGEYRRIGRMNIHSGFQTFSRLCPETKVRENAGKRRSWAPKNCWRAFPGPTEPLMARAG